MRINNWFFASLLIISFCSCGIIEVFSKKELIEAGTPKYVIIHDNDEIPENAEFAVLDEKEVEKLFLILDTAITNYNNKSSKYWRIDLSEYKFQLIPYFNNKSEKVIWVNSICIQHLFEYNDEEKSWREMVLIVDDGGKCHFNIYVNLNTSEAYNLGVNGEA